MTSFLAVTDEGTLTARGEAVVAQKFLPRSEYTPGEGGGGETLPSYAAGERAHTWLAPVYNGGAPSVARIAGQVNAARHADADCHLVAVGDSKTEGYEAGWGLRYLRGWVGVLRKTLSAVEGAVPARPTASDNRWTLTNMGEGNSAQIGILPTASGAWSVTFAFDTVHTGGSFWAHCAAGGTVSVTVDGGAAQNLTIPAGNGFHEITPTVTGDATHTYTLTSSDTVHLALFVPTYTGSPVKVTNLGRGGARADYWQAGYSATQTGLWDVLQIVDATALLVQLGTNQRGNSGSNNATDLHALWSQLDGLNLSSVMIAPGGLRLTGGSKGDYPPMYAALWDIADDYNLPLLDLQSVIGDYATADAAGLMFDDPHENAIGYAYGAAAIRKLIGI